VVKLIPTRGVSVVRQLTMTVRTSR
jgi:hypothetical protein